MIFFILYILLLLTINKHQHQRYTLSQNKILEKFFDTNGPKGQSGGIIPTGNKIDFNQNQNEDGCYVFIKLLSFLHCLPQTQEYPFL